jgi:tRNA(Arg) A34 adenosine deaminase TadA
MSPEALMRVAIDACRRGILAGQTPFGCAIALDGKIIAACHNTVWLRTDITAHAEINAIREACRRTKRVILTGCVVASTCEPCPMCASALHWCRADKVYYGATIDDARAAGFRELSLPARKLLSEGQSPLEIVEGILVEECRELFELWKDARSCQTY